jgi:hypothetical protein
MARYNRPKKILLFIFSARQPFLSCQCSPAPLVELLRPQQLLRLLLRCVGWYQQVD